MNENELLREREKLRQVILKIEDEKKIIENNLSNSKNTYDKDDFVRAQLIYMGNKKLKDIKQIKSKPYFARIDFKADSDKEKERLYIGKISLLDSKTQESIIVDWRAPISNLYYDGRIGRSSYISPEGEITGEISLKRQYFIENQILEKYTDIDLKANDELLQVALEEKADDRLKNIVATIQKEQNAIIRADMNKPLIVQGVAGSGKTTIALHRIAYLIYTYEKEFDPNNFMIIAPNKFFLNYISNVLPDLGVENVKQYTFEDLAYEIIGKRLKISDSNEKLVTIVNREFDDINKGNIDLIIKESKFKSSIKFKELVDKFLRCIEENYIPKKDFILENVRIMRYENMQNLFLNTYKNLSFVRRIDEIKKHIYSKLINNIDKIENIIKRKRTYRINKMLKENISDEEKQERRIEIFEEYEDILKRLDKQDFKLIDPFFEKIDKKDSFKYYKEFICEFIYKLILDKELSNYLINNTSSNLEKGEISFEDLAPIMYIHYKIYGAKFNTKLRHIIIDEAQDYGEFQFSVLKTILNSNSMTILGDIAQGVHFYRGIENWEDFIKVEFKDEKPIYLTLEKTYRTTKDIMSEANNVIDKLPEYEKKFIVKGEPVINRKDSIKILKKDSDIDILKDIINKINEYKKSGYKSIAIIGKDMNECKFIKKNLDNLYKNSDLKENIKLIQSKDSEYNAGISIVPSYLAKGLEFDCVILYNVNDKNYTKSSLDIKLLYVAITRAMSRLDIYYLGNISELL